jgi:large subunit ribosomal protein L10
MQKEDKERVVAELTEKLRQAETLFVADYRGLTMPQIDALRGKLLENGARLSVVKNTLTRRAAEAAGADALLALLEGPTAIAFIEADGDMVAVAKALADSARETRVLEIRGGVMQGREIPASSVEDLAKLPPLEILRGQVLGAVIAPLSAFAALINAPLQNLYGLIDARIEQLQAQGEAGAAPETQGGGEAQAAPEPAAAVSDESSQAEEAPAAEAAAEPAAAVSDESSQAEEAPAAEAAAEPAAESESQEAIESDTQEA